MSEEQETNQNLRDAASEPRLNILLDNLPGMVYRCLNDERWTAQYMSAGAEELTGYPTPMFLNGKLYFADLMHPADRDRVYQEVQAALEIGQSFKVTYRIISASGKLKWVWEQGKAIYKESGDRVALEGYLVDITESKRLEEQLQASQAELRMLYKKLQAVREAERIAIAREVHDQLGQMLSAAIIDIKLLEMDLQLPDAILSSQKISEELQSAKKTLGMALQVVRNIAVQLRPPELEEHGLSAAIAWHARDFERRTRIRCTVKTSMGMHEPSGMNASELFRIFQEAMTNVLRHAKASHVWITLDCRANFLLLRVCDNGIGISIDDAVSKLSTGLKGMRERAALINGRLRIARLRPRGTAVLIRIPLF